MRSTQHLKRNSVSFDPREISAAAAASSRYDLNDRNLRLFPTLADSSSVVRDAGKEDSTFPANSNHQQLQQNNQSQRRRNSYAADAFNAKEKPLSASPSASFATYLCPPSPTSAYGKNKHEKNRVSSTTLTGYNPQRRRNSYAAQATIPEDFYSEIESKMMTSGSSQGGPNSEHLFDANMAAACRRRLPPTPNVLFMDVNDDKYYSPAAIVRRGSSPRVLPNTPHTTLSIAKSHANGSYYQSGTTSFESTCLPPASPKLVLSYVPKIQTEECHSEKPSRSTEDVNNSGIMERRPSTGRRLPLPPASEVAVRHQQQRQQQQLLGSASVEISRRNFKPTSGNTHLSAEFATENFANQMTSSFHDVTADSNNMTANNALQRSASTRQPSDKVPLPPMPSSRGPTTPGNGTANRLTRTTSSSAAAPTVLNPLDDPIAEKVARAISRHPSRENDPRLTMASPPMMIVPASSTPATLTLPTSPNTTTNDRLSAGCNMGRRMPTPDMGAMLQAPSTKQSALQKPSTSAPQSPRSASLSSSTCNSTNGSPRYDETQRFVTPSAMEAFTKTTTGSVIPPQPRKLSDTFESSINRNGSMAFLLEQQHILRKEFCTTSDATGTTPTIITGSNSSSLSPSMEQLNCGGSKSGSDAEEVSVGGSSPSCIDARVHGIDPSLYMAGGSVNTINSSSSYSFNDGSSTPSPAATGATSTVPASASMSWSQQQASTPQQQQQDSSAVSVPSADTAALAQQPRPSGLGLIHCTLQHFPIRKRLRVSVLKIEGLAGELKPELEILPFCKVNLLPGKQKQSGLVKRGRDAVFNQEFFFDNILTEELESKTLSIEVCHQNAQKLQKDVPIGEIFVPLKDLTQLPSKKEVRIVEELKYSMNNKKLGKIHLTTCIEKEARRLTINLLKVDDLPKWGIIGAPDVCVRITLAQGNSPPQTKSSRVLKSTTTAVYKEAVMFLISTKKSDLQHTRITISVHDVSRSVTGNDVIGSVYLGELAMDKTEVEQWRQTIEHWGKEYKCTHHLKLNRQNAPDVHVLETQSDTEDAD